MEGEMKNLVKVWIQAITSLSYCHLITSKIPKGFLRFISILPIVYLFITLPLSFSSFHLIGVTSFFIAWLANFKLLLFAFDQGPLSQPNNNNKLLHYILVASLPIQTKPKPPPKPKNNTKPSHQTTQKSHQVSNFLSLVKKIVLLVMLLLVYDYRKYLHNYAVLVYHCYQVYLSIEIMLTASATLAGIFGFELEPQFNKPHLATSLQNFWGKRWNIMVTNILRPTIYNPARHIFSRIIGQKWTQYPSVIITFVVSGLMHEMINYHLFRVPPTGEVTWFFVLHGISVAVEIFIKKNLGIRQDLPAVVSGPLVMVFVVVTTVWLFFPPLVRSNLFDKCFEEYLIVINYIKKECSYSYLKSRSV